MCRHWLVSLGLLALWDCEIFSDLQEEAEIRSRLATRATRQMNPRGAPIVLRRASVAAVRYSARPALKEGPVGVIVNAACLRREE